MDGVTEKLVSLYEIGQKWSFSCGYLKACQGKDMSLFNPLIFLWGLLVVFIPGAVAEEVRPSFYPFKVTIGGQEAEVDPRVDLFAVLRAPVSATDWLKIEEKSEVLMASVYPCQLDGTVLDGDEVINIFAQNSDRLELKATLKNEALSPGTYLVNVLANGKSARVLFTLADPLMGLTVPRVGDVLRYLKGQS